MPKQPVQIPFPLSTFPGSPLGGAAASQESAGRIINRYAEPLGEAANPTGPSKQVWRRSSGLRVYTPSGQTNFRGSLLVNNLLYTVWNGNLTTLDVNGIIASLGNVTGTDPVSMARDLAAVIDTVIVSPGNGAFSSTGGAAPVAYNGGGNLPQPNSVAFQDGFFHFTIADGRVFASGVNALTQNSQTFVKLQSKSDVALLRGIAYNGMMYFFTTGGCEVWNDTAQPTPAYPYSRFMTMPFGLVQGSAIAGWETGFDDLLWVAQDFNVYRLIYNTLQPGPAVSPPVLNQLIEAQIRKGNTLLAGVYVTAGRKFWYLKSPDWTWEFNLATQKWNERTSLTGAGLQGTWRAQGGTNAFGRWFVGASTANGNIWIVDDTVFAEGAVPMLSRMESGPVRNFPNQERIARADFDFVFGAGQNAANLVTSVVGAAASPSGAVRLLVISTAGMSNNDQGNVANIVGTVEANGSWVITVVDATHVDLQGSVFVHAFTSGGTLTDVTAPANVIAPVCAISCSKDGGITWDTPSVRAIGSQSRTKGVRATVKSRGLTGTEGVRWRVDCSDPVYDGFLGGTMSDDPREQMP